MATIYPNFKNGKIISFKFKCYLGRDNNGKQKWKCTTWTPPKQMAEKRLKIQAEKEAILWEEYIKKESREPVAREEPTVITFNQFIDEIWFPTQTEENGLRHTTIDFRIQLLKTVKPYFEGVLLNDITPEKVYEYLKYLGNQYKTRQNRPLSSKTIKHHYNLLSYILLYATRIGYLKCNPTDMVESPKVPKNRVNALSKNEAMRFVTEVENLPIRLKTAYILLLTTGMRRGECFGLQWQDIDFEHSVIHIKRNVTYTASTGVRIGLPKTTHGIRLIPITERMVNILKEYRDSQGEGYQAHFLFHSEESLDMPQNPTYITKHMKKFMKRVGLPELSPHDLRHTCASLLLQSGTDIKSIQDVLGHADASTTLNFYAKSDLSLIRDSLKRTFSL